MKYDELPDECKDCWYMRCSHIRMDGDCDYWCQKVICFLKYKETPCPQRRCDEGGD